MTSDDSVAGAWFAVRAEVQRFGLIRQIVAVVSELLLGVFVTMGLTWAEFDPRRFCDVHVIRREEGDSVCVFRYTHLAEGSAHAFEIARRLRELNAFDFCRELGIPMERVAGPGQLGPFPEIAWTYVWRRQRASAHRNA